jgi:hypothetical protein
MRIEILLSDFGILRESSMKFLSFLSVNSTFLQLCCRIAEGLPLAIFRCCEQCDSIDDSIVIVYMVGLLQFFESLPLIFSDHFTVPWSESTEINSRNSPLLFIAEWPFTDDRYSNAKQQDEVCSVQWEARFEVWTPSDRVSHGDSFSWLSSGCLNFHHSIFSI